MPRHAVLRLLAGHPRALLLSAGFAFLTLLALAPTVTAAPVTYDETFNDDFAAGRNVPDGVDAVRSSPFGPIDACRRGVFPDPGRLVIQSRDISSLQCPPASRTSCCGPALAFLDGGGTYVTFHYVAGFPIQPGSFVAFQVIGYGDDTGTLTKRVSTDGVNFSPVSGTTGSCAMGNYVIPLPTGTADVYFRLQVGNVDIYDGVIVDNFHAVLYDAPHPAAAVQEGGGSFCTFNAEPFCSAGTLLPIATKSTLAIIALLLLAASLGILATWRGHRIA